MHRMGTYFVTHMVFLHWLTKVSLSSSLCGLTVISSKVLGRAQNSRLAGSTLRLVQLAKLIRPIGFYPKQVMYLIIYLYNLSKRWHPAPFSYLAFFIIRISPIGDAISGKDTPPPMPGSKATHIFKHGLWMVIDVSVQNLFPCQCNTMNYKELLL